MCILKCIPKISTADTEHQNSTLRPFVAVYSSHSPLKSAKLFGDNLITRIEAFFWARPSLGFCSLSALSVWSEKLSVNFVHSVLTHIIGVGYRQIWVENSGMITW